MPETYTDSPILTPRFEQALSHALAHHRTHLRKGTRIPYTSHLLAVAALVLEMHGDEDEAIAALLHDVVEDGGGRAALEEIRDRWGERVADIVLASSDPHTEDEVPWRQRKEARLDAMPYEDASALRVSLADELDNARAILAEHGTHGEALWDRSEAGEGASVRWYYRRLAAAFEAEADRLWPHAIPALKELRRTVDEIDRLSCPAMAPSLEHEWLLDVLPTLTDAEAFAAFESLIAAGHDPEAVREAVTPNLPRLALTYLREPARGGLVAIDPDTAEDRLHVLGGGADALSEAVGVLAELLDDEDGDQQLIDVLAFLDPSGELRIARLLDDEPAPVWQLADLLREHDADRFALLTRRFADLHLILGCPTGRRDALYARSVYLPDGGLGRTAWRDEAVQPARALADAIMAERDGTAGRPRLYLNQASELDWLIALEFGRVDDGQPSENWQGMSAQVGLLLDRPGADPVGFKVLELSSYDPDAPEHRRLWAGPRFDVPQLGLADGTINEIVVATRALYGDAPSLNRRLFNAAAGTENQYAYEMWLDCLQAGDPMAHFALGYTLLEDGRHHEAYRHLRHYTDISPAVAYNWVYRARAARALGNVDEARHCYATALGLEREDPEGDPAGIEQELDDLGTDR